jgi:N-acetylglucosamine-6-phosphate deacetylase
VTVVGGRICPGGGRPSFDGVVAFDGPTIARVEPGPVPGGDRSLRDVVVVPGFVDLQVNGVGGADFAVPDPATWHAALGVLAAHGVTTCCPTLVSAPLDDYAAVLAVAAGVASGPGDGAPRADVAGVHLEGPFLGGAPGAHPVARLRPADAAWLAEVLDAWPGLVRVVTLAPEADTDLAATALLAARGVVVALGHTTAPETTVRAAVDAGATLVTHLFNGMRPLHHRDAGLVGVALDDDRLAASLIADLVHVGPTALRVTIRAKRDLLLVSDAVATGGSSAAAAAVHEAGGAARLADGTLAGATVLLDGAIRNVVALGVPLERAIEMAATNPARVLRLDDRGVLASGRRADVVALDASTLAVRAVWIGGEPLPTAAPTRGAGPGRVAG